MWFGTACALILINTNELQVRSKPICCIIMFELVTFSNLEIQTQIQKIKGLYNE